MFRKLGISALIANEFIHSTLVSIKINAIPLHQSECKIIIQYTCKKKKKKNAITFVENYGNVWHQFVFGPILLNAEFSRG